MSPISDNDFFAIARTVDGYDPDFVWMGDYAGRIIVDRRRQFLYCPVPKCACTAIKHAIIGQDSAYPVHAHQFDVLSTMDDSSKRTFLAEATGLIVVRDPYARVLSAYRNKFSHEPGCFGMDQSDLWLRMGKYIARYAATRQQREPAPLPTFSDFVQFVCDSPVSAMNEHWHPQTELVMLGEISYNTVIKFENLYQEWPALAAKLNLPMLPSHKQIDFAPTNASDLVDSYFTPELREMVARKYKADFDNFDYPV